MAAAGFGRLLLASALLFCFVGNCHGEVFFANLTRTLEVTATFQNGTNLQAGESTITVTWGLNATFPSGTDSLYESVKVRLCYAPVSQVYRAWRATKEPLSKDKTCQFKIAASKYAKGTTTVQWLVQKTTPTAYYFVRVYALDKAGHEVAYGQTTDAHKKENIFFIEAISGRHTSLDIASVCFSAFSVVSLAGFFYMEKRKAKRASHN
uniref:High-affinity nitrate transporter n=1 Tax=Kalanchoe fedtschenkoi TaxID=63787 RepID=A0A7N0ZUQ0_KALFE